VPGALGDTLKENVPEPNLNGVLVVDKPAGMTSHDVVNRVRRIAGTRKVGHLGKLDPMATGVLPLLIERATRLAQFFNKADKVYEASVRFGFATDTYDAEGKATSEPAAVELDAGTLEQALQKFRGKLAQVPPPVSAKKINGTPAYKLARANVEFTLAPVEVEVFSLELLQAQGDTAEIRVHCSAGTYIRSIAHDVGQKLGCGAHLSRLRRIRSGSFDSPMARTLDQLAELSQNGALGSALIPAAELLPNFPSESVDSLTAGFIRQGRDFQVSPFREQPPARYIKAIDPQGGLIAIAEAKLFHTFHPVLVL
jgi:tRNA pseudouridine55 synthase